MIIDREQSPTTASGRGYSFFTCCIIAGRNRIDRRGKVVDNGTLQILRLETFSGPAAGGGAVIPEGAPHAIIVTGAGKQGVDFLDGSLGTAEPELEHAAARLTAALLARAVSR